MYERLQVSRIAAVMQAPVDEPFTEESDDGQDRRFRRHPGSRQHPSPPANGDTLTVHFPPFSAPDVPGAPAILAFRVESTGDVVLSGDPQRHCLLRAAAEDGHRCGRGMKSSRRAAWCGGTGNELTLAVKGRWKRHRLRRRPALPGPGLRRIRRRLWRPRRRGIRSRFRAVSCTGRDRHQPVGTSWQRPLRWSSPDSG